MKHLVCLSVCAILLSACGGGGGTPLGTPSTRTITINVGNDAEADAGGVDPNTPLMEVGDDLAANVKRALLLFPLDAIPNGAVITGAFLRLSFGAKSGTPAASLGRLRFVRYQGNLGIMMAAYFSQELAHDVNSDVLIDLENTQVSIGALVLVQSAVSGGDSALGVRIQYENPTAGPAADFVTIASNNNADAAMRPVLEVVIQE